MNVTLLHTVASLPATFAELAAEHCPNVDISHVVDESLLRDTIRHGMLPATERRVAEHIAEAARRGARAVLVTCSSIGEAAEAAARDAPIPVLRVDEPMARAAVHSGPRVGVLATLAATLGPTRRLVERYANPDTRITSSVCDGAFDALAAGNTARHDEIVAGEILRIAADVDVIVLAQASMARVANAIPNRLDCPVLTSPVTGVRQLTGLR